MVTALGKDEDVRGNVLTCTLCQDELKKPKLLPCQHSFCTPCLVQRHDEKEEGKPFLCPSCELDPDLGDSTIENLPDNYLFDIVKEFDGSAFDSNLKCTPCKEGNEMTIATHKCLDCGDTLCQHCNDWHGRFTTSKHHVVVSLSDLRGGKFKDEFSSRKVRYCDEHSQNGCNVSHSSYCDDCQCLVCIECIQTLHNGHNFAKICTARETHQSKYGEIIKISQRNQSKRVKNFDKAILDTKQKWNHQEAEIYDTATELYDLVDKIKEEKLAKLKAHYEIEIQYLTDCLNEEKKKQNSLDASIDFTEKFLENSSDSDFLYYKDDVKRRMESSQKGQSKSYTRSLVTMERQNTDSISKAIENAYGEVKIQEKDFLHKGIICQVEEIFSHNISNGEIYGLACDNDIYVACSGVIFFSDDCYYERGVHCVHYSADIHVRDSKIARVTYSKGNRKVVIAEQYGKILNSVMLPDDDQESSGQLALVVDDDTNVFISSMKMDKIYKWDPKEDILSVIISEERGSILKSPRYICHTPAGQLVVSSSWSHDIQVYSKQGELQWRYGGEEGYELKDPSGVCCDEDGYIYVLDNGHARIQVVYDRQSFGTIPVDDEVLNKACVPLISTLDGNLIYGYGNKLAKISFWGNSQQ